MRKRLILFLVRTLLGIKTYEPFQFVNQKSDTDYYYFTDTNILKVSDGVLSLSKVSLNWLLNDECEIVPYTPAEVM